MRVQNTFFSSLAASAGALATAALLVSCGASGGGAADDLTEAEKSRIAEEYRDCMAEGGLDANVAFDGGDLNIDVGGGDDTTEEQMLATEAGCEPILERLEAGGPQLTPDEEAELADALLEVQKCLADEGYVITIDGSGINVDGDDQPDGFDEAAYADLEDECFREAAPELYAKYGPGDE